MTSGTLFKNRKLFGTIDSGRVLLLLLPGLILIGTFTFYPIIKMFIMSFFDWKIGLNQVSPFVGLKNYLEVFTDPIAGKAMVNTLYYAIVTVPIQMLSGLFVALLLNGIRKFNITLRLLYYLPVITSWVVVALLFRYIFSNEGLLNYLLNDVLRLIPGPIGWLSTRWNIGVTWRFSICPYGRCYILR